MFLRLFIEKSTDIQVSYSNLHRENNTVPRQAAIPNAKITLNDPISHSPPSHHSH